MISASWFIITRTVLNRFVRRLRRLREPRYLFGAIVGAAYLYFSVFARMGGSRSARRRRGRQGPSDEELVLPALAAFGPPIGGLALFAVSVLCWVLPVDASLLDFSDAEVQFLFPAPITRRQLIVHRLLRSQIGLLFASLVPAILSPATSISMRLQIAVAMWLLLVTGKVYFMGVTLARGHFRSRDRMSRLTAWTPAVLVLAGGLIVAVAVVDALRGFAGADLDTVNRLAGVSAAGASRIVLAPFVALARALFAGSLNGYLAALLPAVAVLVVTVCWVIWSDEVFQADVTQMTAGHRGPRAGPAPSVRGRASGWKLAPSGRSEAVFFWKNAMQAFRGVHSLALVRYLAPLGFLTVVVTSLRLSAAGARGVAAGLGTFALFAAGFAVLLGPQIVRTDLRMDLGHLDQLKTWPVAPAEIVRGEMLWPGVAVTSAAWFALACGLTFSAASLPRWSLAWRLSSAAGAVLLAPALVFAQLTVHNAAAVLFPAWVPLGNQRPRGLDAMGQRLILFGGVLLTLIVVIGPGAIAAGILWIALYDFIGAAVVVIGAVACLTVVAVELWLLTEILGRSFESVDLSGVERVE